MPTDITFTMTDDQVARATVVGQEANPSMTNPELKAALEKAARRGVVAQLRDWQQEVREREFRESKVTDELELNAEFADEIEPEGP